MFRPSYPEDDCGKPVGQLLHVSLERSKILVALSYTAAE